jgi:hypothetical protein
MSANGYNTGIASEYLILHKLFRLELEAYMTQGNKKSIDIRVIKGDKTAISIDVKAVRGYSSLVVNNIVSRKDHFIIFVVYNNKFEDLTVEPKIFIAPSEVVVKSMVRDFKKERRVLKKTLEAYEDRWDLLMG